MTEEDVAEVCRKVPQAKIIAVHMEAINHCLLSRADLFNHLEQEELSNQVFIPMDGGHAIWVNTGGGKSKQTGCGDMG